MYVFAYIYICIYTLDVYYVHICAYTLCLLFSDTVTYSPFSKK